ncbi:MAG TPA: GNAT family N-acetyltransferase [Solirubrobacteraceae bacterium]|nr:GNAT family N-acetyltransferase [Solirubrobacteraceae bacterium]
MLTFRYVAADEEPAASLLDAMRVEIAAMYDDLDLDGAGMPKAGPTELGPPGGTFLVGFDDAGRAVCCGGIKRLQDGACEIKRMYVVPEGRGRGVGRELLEKLEQAAGELGYRVVRLDTGPRQPGAERMYRQAGYRPIGNFNANPVASFFGEKQLS